MSCLTICSAQTAEVAVPKTGAYYYWFTYTDIGGKTVTTTPRSFKEKKAVVDLPMVKDTPAKSSLYLLDASSGNEAIVLVNAKLAEPTKIKVDASGFNRVRRVEVLVSSAATQLPAASGIVKLEIDGQPAQTQVIDPSSQGVGYFSDVPAGSAKVTVEYGEGKSTSNDVDISADRKTPVLKLKVPVVGEIETIQPAASTPSKHGDSKENSEPKGYSFSTAMIGMFLFFAVLSAIYMIVRTRGAKVREALLQMGIDIPEDAIDGGTTPSAVASSDPNVCSFCGGKKDPVTGACACSIGAGSSRSATSADSGPRLIATQGAYMGSIFTLGGDSVTIGRAETNNVALPQDSTASRNHARISNANGQYTVHDAGSSNGTFVNGVKITEQALHSGDEIQVGSTRLRFEV